MKKLLAILLAVAMILPCFAVNTVAAEWGTQPTSWTLATGTDCTYDNATKEWYIPVASRKSTIVPNDVEGGWTGIESITFDFGAGSSSLGSISVVYSDYSSTYLCGWNASLTEFTAPVDPTKTIIAIMHQAGAAGTIVCGVTFNYPESTKPVPVQPDWVLDRDSGVTSGTLTYDPETKELSGSGYQKALFVPAESNYVWDGAESVTIDFGGDVALGSIAVVYTDGEQVYLGGWKTASELTFALDPTREIKAFYYNFPATGGTIKFDITLTYAEGQEPEEVLPTPPTPPTPPAGSTGSVHRAINGIIYLNEQYHALMIRIPVPGSNTNTSLVRFLAMPHIYGANGVCVACRAVEVVETPAAE